MTVRCEAFFFGAGRGARFCLLTEPAGGPARGAVLFVPPFAEELNRSRRGAARCARALAAAGWVVLQMDLAGCGDSGGDFVDANWNGWLDDLRHGITILSRRSSGPLWLWGVRAGALLACDLVKLGHVGTHAHLLLWQPVTSGAQHIKQFLRLRMARESTALSQPLNDLPQPALAMADAAVGASHSVLDIVSHGHAARRARGASHQLRSDWISGKPVEVAGYTVSPALAFSLDRAVFELPAHHAGAIHWLECARPGLDAALPASRSCVKALRHQGLRVHLHVVEDEPFWQTTEIAHCPALVAASVAALESRP